MKYKNPTMRKFKNTHPLLVSCNLCKTPLLVYQKGGKGNLIKLQFPRIIESEFDLEQMGKGLFCIKCGEQLGSLSEFDGNPTYYLIRGLTHSKNMQHYKY